MKKLIAVLISALLCLSVIGCGKPEDTTADIDGSASESSILEESTFSELPIPSVPFEEESTGKSEESGETQKTQGTHVHNFANATCEKPMTCACGATQGTPYGHAFRAATCTEPKVCMRCGATEGSPLGHSYSNGYCVRCKKVDPANATKLGGRKNPAKIGDTVTFEFDKEPLYGKGTVQVTLTKVVRGEEARRYIESSNRYNPSLPSGFEFIMAYFTIKTISDKSNNQGGVKVANFILANSQYVKQSGIGEGISVPPGDVPCIIETGAVPEGSQKSVFVCHENPIGEKCYFVLEAKALDNSRDIWFDVNS